MNTRMKTHDDNPSPEKPEVPSFISNLTKISMPIVSALDAPKINIVSIDEEVKENNE